MMLGKEGLARIILLLLFALAAIFASTSTVHGNAIMPDLEKHGAQNIIQKMLGKSIAAGYPDGIFQPRGGGENSIHFNGGRYNNIVLGDIPGGSIRLAAADTEGLRIIISEEAAGAEIILEGTFAGVTIQAGGIILTIRGEAVLNEVKVPENIAGTVINVEKKSRIKELILDSIAIVNNDVDTLENVSGKKAADSKILNPPRKAASFYGGAVLNIVQKPEIMLEGIAEISSAGLYDHFTVSVNKGDCGERVVVGRIEILDGDAADLELSYLLLEGDKERWAPIGMDGCWFGDPEGKALDNLAERTEFRICWKENAGGTYKFAVGFFAQGGGGAGGGADGVPFGQVIASRPFEVEVVQGDPVLLTHAFGNGGRPESGGLTGDPISTAVNAGDEVEYTVEADLAHGICHLDNFLYIIEFEKDGLAAGDFEIIALSGCGESGAGGINDTLILEGNKLRGCLGPETGFKFGENPSISLPLSTTFTIKFNTAGEYLINVYAIQVRAQPS